MREWIQQLKWQTMLLARNQMITISIVVTAFYAGIFFALKDLPNIDKVLVAIVLNDPATIGLLFIGIAIIIERREKVLSALFVAPMNLHIYLWSRILTLTMLGWVCALGMVLMVVGSSFHWVHFSAGVIGVSMLCCIVGVWLVSYSDSFMDFALKSIPILALFVNLPLLNYLGLYDVAFFKYLPIQGSMDLIINAFEEEPNQGELLWGYLSILFWGSIFYGVAYRAFLKKVVREEM